MHLMTWRALSISPYLYHHVVDSPDWRQTRRLGVGIGAPIILLCFLRRRYCLAHLLLLARRRRLRRLGVAVGQSPDGRRTSRLGVAAHVEFESKV